jgi:outer membrane protein assembly factor BamB
MKNKILFLLIIAFSLSYKSISSPLPKLLWKTNVGTVSEQPIPLFHNDKIYIGNEEGQLLCLDNRGKELWKVETEAAIMASPVIFDEKLLVTNKAGKLYCLRPGNGKEIWTFEAGEKILSAPVGNKDHVYFYTKHKIWAIEKEVGIDMWSTDFYFNGFPKLQIDEENIYFSDDMKIYSISQKNGGKNWEAELPVFGVSDVTIGGAKLFCMTPEKLYAFNTADGKIAWEKENEIEIKAHSILSPTCNDNFVFFSIMNNIFCLNPENGEEIYKIKDKNNLSKIFISQTDIYYHNGSSVYFKPAESKKKAEEVELTEKAASKFIFYADERVYFYNDQNELCAYSMR